jgi:hypothetical protein
MNYSDNSPLLRANRLHPHRRKERQAADDLLKQVEKHLQNGLGGELLPDNPAIEEDFIRLRTHYNNICRYRELKATTLTSSESEFIERRLMEENFALEALISAAVQQYDQGSAIAIDLPRSESCASTIRDDNSF